MPDAGQTRDVSLPGSKSIAARALILSEVYKDAILIGRLPDCDDTEELAQALRQFDKSEPGGTYNLGTGGTSLRFFLALAASWPGFEGVIDCAAPLKRRPLGPLVDALRAAGADIECLEREGHAPMRVRGRVLDGTGVRVASGVSSQYASALLMVSPLWKHPFVMEGDAGVSRPYLDMTARMIQEISSVTETRLYYIEPDWSAASYFYELALLSPDRDIMLDSLVPEGESLQGDSACERIFRQLGVETVYPDEGGAILRGSREAIEGLRLPESGPVVLDLNGTPDLVPALAVGLCMTGIRFRFEGIGHLRHKESDRLAVLREELGKAGFEVRDSEDSLEWTGGRCPTDAYVEFDSHGDHRIAMAFSVAAAVRGAVVINGAEAVEKSFRSFYDQLEGVGFKVKYDAPNKRSTQRGEMDSILPLFD